MHLYGAEWSCWRIDQDAQYFQGWNRTNNKPGRFPTVRYSDADGNGFFDTIEYDLDGDKQYEQTVRLAELGIDDTCPIVETGRLDYQGVCDLHKQSAEKIWKRAAAAVEAAERLGIDTSGYAVLKNPHSLRQKYHYGYWLS
jgi:hypothetical protein